MNEETLYSAPLSVNDVEENRGIQACFDAAAACQARADYLQAEKELLAAIAAEDALYSDLYPLCLLMLGRLYLQGKTAAGEPDNALAVKYLEQGLELAPAYSKDYAGDLGTACESAGKKVAAIHWYRVAVEQFGQTAYREPLYRLYLTGIAGAAKKREAEEQMRWMQ